jgi:VCBS repeat-containing protein
VKAAQVAKNRALALGFMLAVLVVMSLLAAGPARADTFTVRNTDNTGPESLRQAILDANDEVNHPGADTISFAISGAGPHTIAPTSELPVISAPVTIDGYTQTGASENTLTQGTNAVLEIELNFANVTISNNIGLDISAGNSTVRGLVINGAPSFPAIGLRTKGGNVIEGNFIGTNPAGTAARPGNGSAGEGISLGVGSGNNVIGGTTPAARNLISGNISNGVRVGLGNSGEVSQNNRVEGNLIGTDAAGTSAIPNLHGVNVRGPASNNTIGGTTAAARNIISGNTTYGVFLESSPDTVVQGNFIGTDVTGAAAVPNVEAGVATGRNPSSGSANNVFIGGGTAGAGNVISGNGNADSIFGDGIFLGEGGAAVQGNVIGRNASGAAPLGNRKTGITVASNGNTIGGAGPGAGNTIASNGFFGVSIREQSIQRIPILSNSIFSNAQLGINLSGNDSSPYGVTLNDLGDGDGFVANQGQNFPEISDASVTGSKATVSGKLNSTGGTTFRLEFFSSAACDPSGYGEGQTFIGSTSVMTESDGNQNFTFTSPDEFEVPAGQSVITSTATDPINNTSEFSKCLTATGAPPNTAPEATDDPNTPGDPNYTTNEGTPLTVSAANGVLANDLDPNSDPLTAVKVSNPTNGSVTLNANGSFVYTPNNDFTGTDSFTYKANDGQADSNVATVTVNVQGTGGDTTRPTVFSVDPPQGKTGVPRTNNITVTFSEEMDTSTSSLNANTVRLVKVGTTPTSVPVTITTSTDASGRTVLTLDPFGPTTQKLGKKTTYKLTIEGANDIDGFAVKDLASNELAADYVSSFKTKRR